MRGSAVERAVTPRATRETDKQLRERMQPAPQHRRPSSLQRQQRREKQTVLGKKSQREMSDSLKGRGGRTRDVARSQGRRRPGAGACTARAPSRGSLSPHG